MSVDESLNSSIKSAKTSITAPIILVFLTPTSSTPFNPVELKCAMAAEVGRGIAPNPDYKWRERYSHKKLQKVKKKRTWCTYNKYKNYVEGHH